MDRVTLLRSPMMQAPPNRDAVPRRSQTCATEQRGDVCGGRRLLQKKKALSTPALRPQPCHYQDPMSEFRPERLRQRSQTLQPQAAPARRPRTAPEQRAAGGGQRLLAPCLEADDDGNDSDDEDRRNGVPITISQQPPSSSSASASSSPSTGVGRPFHPSMVRENRAEIRRLLGYRRELRAQARELRQLYLRLRERFMYLSSSPPSSSSSPFSSSPFSSSSSPAAGGSGSGGRGAPAADSSHWVSARRWASFLHAEEAHAGFQAELLALDRRVQDLVAENISFRDHAQPSRRGRWSREGDTVVWSLTSGADEFRRRRGGDVPLDMVRDCLFEYLTTCDAY
ncbi:hypothetical protein GGR56DRAFT_695852 [Xylariaceae sp. FL0804]|nr:hypothetical protein GGR56DRAFT_695852 [Xylariaceae sp. FL0804]